LGVGAGIGNIVVNPDGLLLDDCTREVKARVLVPVLPTGRRVGEDVREQHKEQQIRGAKRAAEDHPTNESRRQHAYATAHLARESIRRMAFSSSKSVAGVCRPIRRRRTSRETDRTPILPARPTTIATQSTADEAGPPRRLRRLNRLR